MSRFFARWAPPIVAFGLVALAWQLVAPHQSAVLPSLSSVLAELGDHPGFFASNAGYTLEEVGAGLVLSFGCAFSLAIAMVHLPIVERALWPLAVVLNVTPILAIAPALVFAFGFGIGPRFLVTAIVTFFPFLANALVGLRSIDSGALEIMRTLDASQREVLWRLRLPSSLPFLFAAARICFPLSVVGAVVAEFETSGRPRGLGSLIAYSDGTGSLPPMYAAILCLAAIGVLLSLGVTLVERRLLSWHPSQAVYPLP